MQIQLRASLIPVGLLAAAFVGSGFAFSPTHTLGSPSVDNRHEAEVKPASLLLPPILLTEVMFDPIGKDGDQKNWEWIELFVAADCNPNGYKLQDNLGNVITTFPNQPLEAGTTLIGFLGDTIPFGFPSGIVDRRGALALGLPTADLLNNSAGGVRLLNNQNVIIDCVYWGTGQAPAGASGASWPGGDFLDISLSGTPISEGESIGRPAIPAEGYTGTKSDWCVHGGKNAMGPTACGRNGIFIGGNTPGLAVYAQAVANQMMSSYSLSQNATTWLEITRSHVSDWAVTETVNSTSVTALHTFVTKKQGVTVTYSGALSVLREKSEDPVSLWCKLSLEGTLAGTDGTSFVLDCSEHYSQPSLNIISLVGETSFTYTEGATNYPITIATTQTITRSSLTEQVVHDERNATDYGGAGTKSAITDSVITKLSDGVYSLSTLATRSSPMGPPALSNAGTQQLLGTESISMTRTQTARGDGEVELPDSLITQFSRSLNGNQTHSLRGGEQGSLSAHRFMGGSGTLPSGVAMHFILPLDAQGVSQDYFSSVAMRTIYQNEHIYSVGSYELKINDVVQKSGSLYFDPIVRHVGTGLKPATIRSIGLDWLRVVLQFGCEHCPDQNVIHIHQCDICDPPPDDSLVIPDYLPSPPPSPEDGKSPGGLVGAMVGCAVVGGTIGGAAGMYVGSAAGGVGAVPGGTAGGIIGGVTGLVGCGLMYLFDWW